MDGSSFRVEDAAVIHTPYSVRISKTHHTRPIGLMPVHKCKPTPKLHAPKLRGSSSLGTCQLFALAKTQPLIERFSFRLVFVDLSTIFQSKSSIVHLSLSSSLMLPGAIVSSSCTLTLYRFVHLSADSLAAVHVTASNRWKCSLDPMAPAD